MTDCKQLCVELLSELENAIRVIYNEDDTRHISSAYPVINKVKKTLAEPESERLTVAQIKELPDNGENFIWEDPRGTGWIDLDGTFSRDDLQQLANSLPIAAPRSEND